MFSPVNNQGIVTIQPQARVRSAFWGKIASAGSRSYYRWLLALCASRSDFIGSLALSLSPKCTPHSRLRLNSYKVSNKKTAFAGGFYLNLRIFPANILRINYTPLFCINYPLRQAVDTND
jgi:hypothetical protein